MGTELISIASTDSNLMEVDDKSVRGDHEAQNVVVTMSEDSEVEEGMDSSEHK